MIAELQAERDRLSEAIVALERLSLNQARTRGRPPRWVRGDTNVADQDGQSNVDDKDVVT